MENEVLGDTYDRLDVDVNDDAVLEPQHVQVVGGRMKPNNGLNLGDTHVAALREPHACSRSCSGISLR